MAKTPKVEKAPDPPPPMTPVTEDTAAIDARARERQRTASRQGNKSTILAGSVTPTAQAKTLLGG